MKTGRPPKSAAEKQLKGTERGNQRPPEPQVIPLDTFPEPPAYIGEAGVEYWNSVGRSLHNRKVLTEENIHSFAVVCEMWGTWRDLWKIIREEDYTTVLSNGVEAPHPKYKPAMEALKLWERLGAQFGLTPVTSKAVPEVKAKPKSKLSELRKTA